jgi:hypothetical protein
VSESSDKRIRINIRVPAELMTWARTYARRNHTTVTALIVESLLSLRQADAVVAPSGDGEAPQI